MLSGALQCRAKCPRRNSTGATAAYRESAKRRWRWRIRRRWLSYEKTENIIRSDIVLSATIILAPCQTFYLSIHVVYVIHARHFITKCHVYDGTRGVSFGAEYAVLMYAPLTVSTANAGSPLGSGAGIIL